MRRSNSNMPKETSQDDPRPMCATLPLLANIPSGVPWGSPTIIHPRTASGIGDEHHSPTLYSGRRRWAVRVCVVGEREAVGQRSGCGNPMCELCGGGLLAADRVRGGEGLVATGVLAAAGVRCIDEGDVAFLCSCESSSQSCVCSCPVGVRLWGGRLRHLAVAPGRGSLSHCGGL